MPLFKKESLEVLRERVDLIDLLSAHIDLKRAGASYKALCPFHEEKSPSFVVRRGDTHYHCFGCGAHGDAVAFLTDHLRMGFVEAVEYLGERYGVALDKTEGGQVGSNLGELKRAMALAAEFYQTTLLHADDGRHALAYLQRRGLDLPFIKKFQLGLAPAQNGLLRRFLEEHKVPHRHMQEVGLLKGAREFFHKRILFPITDGSGSVIGFSGRRFTDDVGGGKYINTPETPLFRKSQVLFGLSYSRRRMAKEQSCLVVEGQIDALRLIHEGFDYTVAGQGTAFGKGQVREVVRLGVTEVILALDSDKAGRAAAAKIGNLFQKEGIGVRVARLPEGKDPDSLLKDRGTKAFKEVIDQAVDYLAFLVDQKREEGDATTPAGKSQLVQAIAEQIRGWKDKVMIHESLRKLAHLTSIPEETLGIADIRLASYTRPSGSVRGLRVDPNRVLEGDVLCWLLLCPDEPTLLELSKTHLTAADFHHIPSREIFTALLESGGDRLSALSALEGEAQEAFIELLSKRINRERASLLCPQAVQKLLERNWLEAREAVRQKIQQANEAEVLDLVKEFDRLNKRRPSVTSI